MKMVKSLLLGTAAGFVAIAGAQAADLPVKAKPVQYVKICSLYGAGFYYIPGTDMCSKSAVGSVTTRLTAPTATSTNGALVLAHAYRTTAPRITSRGVARGYITADARNQTEYGTASASVSRRRVLG